MNQITDEQVVQACRDWQPLAGVLAQLHRSTGEPEKACAAAMRAARDRGLIDWGVDMSSAWVTPAGDQLLGEAAR